MNAVLQGEFHVSGSDREKLLSHVSEDTDAVFIEGRSNDIGGRDLSVGYVVFLVGTLFFLWGQSKIATFSGQSVKEQIREQGIPIHDEIDRGYSELYSDYPEGLKVVVGGVMSLMFLWSLIMPTDFRIVQVGAWQLNLTLIERFLLIITPPVGYAVIYVLTEQWLVGDRDSEMIENILDITDEAEYEEVVISCGQSHLKPIAEKLEAEGWNVESHDTNHTFWARLFQADLVES